MLNQDYFILMGVGGLFILLGIALAIWGIREENNYYNTLATRAGDVREFMNHWPQRQQPGALKIGGWLALSIGIILLAIGVVLYLIK